MKSTARVLALCLAVLLLLLSATACRNRDFHPKEPPADGGSEDGLGAGFQCWVTTGEGREYALTGDSASALFDAAVKAFEKSDSIERFPDKDGGIRLVFCLGGSAPESVIPAYQLPNARHYGVYTLFPDDTGRYSDVLLTANVKSFQLKEGSFSALLALAEQP